MNSLDAHQWVVSVGCSSDNRRVAVGCRLGGKAFVWDSISGDMIELGDVTIQFVNYVAFLDKTNGVITGGGEWVTPLQGRLTFWQLRRKSATKLGYVKLARPPVVQLSDDGRLYVFENRNRWFDVGKPAVGEIHVWDAHKAKKLSSQRLRSEVLRDGRSHFFSCDGQLLAVIQPGRKTIKIWKIADLIRSDEKSKP